MTPLEAGAAIGGRASTAGAAQAQALLSGGQQAANLRLAGGLGAAQAIQQAGKQFGGLFANRITPVYDYGAPATSSNIFQRMAVAPSFYGE